MAQDDGFDWLKVSTISTCFVLTIYLSLQIQSSAIFEDTLISSFALLLSIGLAIRAASRYHAPSPDKSSDKPRPDHALPIHRIGGDKSASAGRLATLRKLRLIQVDQANETKLFVLTTLLLVRAECARVVLRHVACIGSSYAPLLPAVVAAATFLIPDRHLADRKHEKTDLPHSWGRQKNWLTKTQLAILFVLCYVVLQVLRSFSPPLTTYICATSSPAIWAIPLLQHIGTALDAALLYCLVRILQPSAPLRSPTKQTVALQLIGSAFTLSAIWLLFFHSLYYLIMHPFVPRIPILSHAYLWSLFKVTPIVTAFAVSAILTALYLDVIFTSTILAVLTASAVAISQAGTTPHSRSSEYAGVFLMCLMYIQFAIPLRARMQSLGSKSSKNKSHAAGLQLLYLTFCVVVCVAIYSRDSLQGKLEEHPIDGLMRDARSRQQALIDSAKQSNNLHELVENYSTRYGRLPPPHFDKWYQYAISRNSTFIDNFDSIHQDLLPFYGLQPAVIRNRTFELIANPWNGISAISVRDGHAYLGPRIGARETHYMDELRTMINKFAEHLPDMDVAFNIYDEPRVAVPFERKQYLEEMAHLHEIVHVSQGQFQPGRSLHWPRLPTEGKDNSVMREVAYHVVWEQFATAGCSPSSPARTQHLWNHKSACFACSAPHAPYGIVANWTLAADVCHQPDLANLHGFFMAQDAYKGTNKLYPVFSTAKGSGFNDILYPHVQSYADMARSMLKSGRLADRAWENKTAALFWRGSTTEGVSYEDRRWQGMLRQRFVHLIKNIKNTSPAAALLFPAADRSGDTSQTAVSVPAQDIEQLFQVDVEFAPDITRCRGSDCDLQRWEFAPSEIIQDVSSYFQHKFVLDMDGTGFSKFFLPLLHSESIPLQVGIFREWWHDRVTPWLHFVPLDVRGHGLWATLAYFTGLHGSVAGQTVDIAARDEQARSIAEAGKQWARQALRQEDMEIYMFRLLLEWGRMTDDWRDEIGFAGNKDITS